MIIPQESKESPIQIESERTEDNEDNTKTQTFEKIQTNEEQYIFHPEHIPLFPIIDLIFELLYLL